MFEMFLDDYKSELNEIVKDIDPVAFQEFIEILKCAYQHDRQVFITGNGGSAATANHFVVDFGKNAVREPGKRRFRIISLCDNVEKITAFGNDVSFDEIFSQQLMNLMNEEDVLILISASGNSPDLVKVSEYAKGKNAHIVVLAGFEGGKIKQFADVSFVAPVSSYERIEDIHLIIMHMVVLFFKEHPEYLNM
jgi:D-sedoheptulose 7-phosphate isomerase